MRSRLYLHRFSIALALVLVLGLLGGMWGWQREKSAILDGLKLGASRAASIFSIKEAQDLKGNREDLETGLYADVKSRLMRYRGADLDIRFVYIFRAQGDGVIFLVDSEPTDSPDLSLPGEDYPEAKNSPGLMRILKNGAPATEGPLVDSYGTWVTGYAVLARDADGRVKEVVGIDMSARDWWTKIITAGVTWTIGCWLLLGLPLAAVRLRRLHREQREVIRNLSEAIEQSHAAVVIVDLQGRIEYANGKFCEQTGYGRRELSGRSWKEFLRQSAPVDSWVEMDSAMHAQLNWSGEWENVRKDSTRYPVRAVVNAVRNRHEVITCYVVVYEDQSEMRQNEKFLREAKEHAEAGDRAKSQFLATMSHEVRTPLNGIVGFTNLLLETPLNAEQQEYMQTIRSSGEALIQLTNDILDFARIESGNLQLDLQSCDPRECVEEALDLMAPRASAKKIELLHWVEDSVPELVMADAGRLRQVLINLVNNAVKFTEVGEVAVTLSAERTREAEGERPAEWELHFTIRDTGIGIDEKKYDILFRPFSQVEISTTRRYGGTGLGLAISRNLVELMEGSIGLESEVGVGSVFKFSIKAKEAADDSALAEASPPNISGLRLAIAAQPGGLRKELFKLAQRWNAQAEEMLPDDLSAKTWDTAVVDLPDDRAVELSEMTSPPTGWSRDRMIALVTLGLPSKVRTALRPHFRMLVNKPVHHTALRAALAAPASQTLNPFPIKRTNSFDLRVLLVEDNSVNQRLMQKVLANLGCAWVVAENGQVALEELNRTKFNVVLMDLHMPVMDGLTAIKGIREGQAGEAMRSVWITALTADARIDQKERVMKAGANDYLVKPVRLADLQKMLERYVAAQGGK